jgi:hypothetical protein
MPVPTPNPPIVFIAVAAVAVAMIAIGYTGKLTPYLAQSQAGVCAIKGNISSSGERIYHMPGQRYYDKTHISVIKGERWFCTEQEAVDAGWRKAKV